MEYSSCFSSFCEKCNGRVRIECYHKASEQSTDEKRDGSTGDITLGKSKTLKLSDVPDVKDGDYITAYANVALGKDKSGKVWFIADKKSTKVACFTIGGTTLDNELGYVGIEDL
ncbi:MAG: hypothetical protein IJ916_05755 [Paludibacteraceae bacterium]|nr:hypothetical protein [Paludibacteraceae bacterium]